jgi:hypothetical protein
MAKENTFKITKEWIKEHGTKGMGFTKEQHRVIGSDGLSGWIDRAEGTYITELQKEAFETSKSKKGKYIHRKEKELRKAKNELLRLLIRVTNRLEAGEAIEPNSDLHELLKVKIKIISNT